MLGDNEYCCGKKYEDIHGVKCNLYPNFGFYIHVGHKTYNRGLLIELINPLVVNETKLCYRDVAYMSGFVVTYIY
jgi:hypothetical protein